MTTTTEGKTPPKVSGGDTENGHLEEMRTDPIGLLHRIYDECGIAGEFKLGDKEVVLFSGPDANEQFFRAPDADLNQAAAYPFMTPIFGEGVIFDASPERRKEMMRSHALKDSFMRGHAEKIQREVEEFTASLGDEGEIDLLEFFAELTIYTSSTCLIGRKFREELDPRFSKYYHDLEQGTDALAFVDMHADIPSFTARDKAREELVNLVQNIIDSRGAGTSPEGEDDLLDILVSVKDDEGNLRFDADQITGMFISLMFAGHHTTSGTSAWMLIEMMRNPDQAARVIDEIDKLLADGDDVSYMALRAMPKTEAALKETLRLHPPLILLMRQVEHDMGIAGYHIPAGKLVAASPRVSNRMPECFPNPEQFDIERYLDKPTEEQQNPWMWIPFGAGKHRCVGAAFAMMQMKAIFAILLKDWVFEPLEPVDSYHDNVSKMVIQLAQPCRVKYRRRTDDDVSANVARAQAAEAAAAATDVEDSEFGTRATGWRVVVDRDLCQGHAVCQSESPSVFELKKGDDEITVKDIRPLDDMRDSVEEAIEHCPTHALNIVEE